ncbi:MAG: DUF1566 domain-containing protein [SAR324 cluster bacterium]|nr:DUF1566 domain-containing protein [SAR324 cluster bacterium]
MKPLLSLLLLLFITLPVHANTMKEASEELARQLTTKLKTDTKEDLVVNVYHYLTKKEDSKAGDISGELFIALRNQFRNARLMDARDAGIAGTSYNVLWLDVAYEPKGKMIVLQTRVLQGLDKKIIIQMKAEYETDTQQTMLMGVFDIDSTEWTPAQKTAYSRVFRSALSNQGFKLSSTADTDQKKIESLKEVGCTLDKCAIEVGKENKMTHVVATQRLKLGEKKYQFSATLHDIEKGSSTTEFVEHDGNPDTINPRLEELAALLAGKKTGSGRAAFVSVGPVSAGVSGVELITPQVSGNTASSMAILVITSIPSAAEVFLGNAKAGKTPYQKTGLQAGQTLRVTLKKPDYHDKTLELPLSGGTNKFTNLKLIPRFGSLQITSDPPGAEVYLADEKVGETPYSNDHVLSGTYLMSLRKPLYLPLENQSVEIRDGGTLPLKLKLEPNFGETLVESLPAGAAIKVYPHPASPVNRGGEESPLLTETSPATLKLEPGEYRLLLEKTGYASLEFKLNVARGQQQTIRGTTATLRKLEGTVTITATPFEDGTRILVDGQDMGEAPAVLKLSAGSHEITVRSADKEGTQTLTVKDQQSLEIEIRMEEGLKMAGGLVWQTDDGGALTWNDAVSYCDSLSASGQTDWRLPTPEELLTLVDYGKYNPATSFPNMKSSFYWSSSSPAYDSGRAWTVYFSYGNLNSSSKSVTYYVRCVRGGGESVLRRFDYLERGQTVVDRQTGLEWQKADGGEKTWNAAVSYCEGLRLGGYEDWRLPAVKELEFLLDRKRFKPATSFPNMKSSNYWSSTSSAGHSSYAWDVSFLDGSVVSVNKYDTSYVRCVRGGG